jgi:hypothetical protein
LAHLPADRDRCGCSASSRFAAASASSLRTFAGVSPIIVRRRAAIRITQSLALVQAVVLAVLTWSGYIAVWHLIVLRSGSVPVSAFDIPLGQSLWVQPRRDRADLPNAIALNSFLVNAARVVGPALAGVLLGLVSEPCALH